MKGSEGGWGSEVAKGKGGDGGGGSGGVKRVWGAGLTEGGGDG